MRGYCGIGIVGGKSAVNVGTLWRTAANFGADFIFTAGRRYPDQTSDTVKAWRHTPAWHFAGFDDFYDHLPRGCVLVGVELDERAVPIEHFRHPQRAVYLLGSEDNGLPPRIRGRCHVLVQLPGKFCLNVATAGAIVLYDRRLSPQDAAT